MKPEEAIEILERLKIATATSNVDGHKITQPLCMAIEALEKQIPKKPRERHPFKSFGSCGACGINISTRTDKNYCGNCGQAIDWEVEE